MYSLVLLTALTTGTAGPSSGNNAYNREAALCGTYACPAPYACYAPAACYAPYAPYACSCCPSGAPLPQGGDDDFAELRRLRKIFKNLGDPDFGWDRSRHLTD